MLCAAALRVDLAVGVVDNVFCENQYPHEQSSQKALGCRLLLTFLLR